MLLLACNSASHTNTNGDTTTSSISITETIAQDRETPKPNAIATYEVKLNNDLNDWYFRVKLFETNKRFVYKVTMQYQEITGEDMIEFPNLGYEPLPELRKGPSDLECIVGFLDQNKTFREYKLVSAKNDQLKITTLKRYAVYAKE